MDAEGGFPSLLSLTEHLRPYRGARALVVSTAGTTGRALGNNGDDLMHAVFYRILEQMSIAVVDSDPDVVIVPPSGALLEVYSFPKRLSERLRGFEDVPVVIFPSSAYFPTEDPSLLFTDRTADTLLLLREHPSYEHLRKLWGDSLRRAGVRLEVDHDVVASGHEFVPDILRSSTGRSVPTLIAARIDREASSLNQGAAGGNGASSLLHRLADRVPYGPAYTRASRMVRRRRNREAALKLAAQAGSPARNALSVDISARQFATFDQYCSTIVRSETVITNRLHVALPAAIMGKSVVMVEAGYYKLGGVYRRSLEGVPNVRFIDGKR